MTRNILKSSVENASFSIIFQILFRCITFVLNAFIIRHVGQTVLGIMNVRLLLLESTILFLSREPILKACLTDTKSHNWAQVINQIWLTVPLTGLVSLLLVYVWTNVLSSTEDMYLEQYHWGCYSIAVSCIIDQITQCIVLVGQSYCFVRLKVVLDSIYVMSRTIIFVMLVLRYPDFAINVFSFAQVASSVIYFLTHYIFFYWYIRELNKEPNSNNRMFKDMHDFPFKSILDFLPGFMTNKDGLLNMDLCKLTISFFKQCIVKQILTEGERYVMTISPVLSFSQQSMYDIVNNLGSLAARFIFRPIEDSGYFYFTQMIKRGELISEQEQKNVVEATSVLSHLCRVVTSIGFIVVVFGQSYSYTLLYLYGGNVLTDDPLPTTLLQFHCVAVLLLAVNGVTECYVFATMNNRELDKYNYVMVLFSITFLAISYLLTNVFGPVGFILANCVNMSARIIHRMSSGLGPVKLVTEDPIPDDVLTLAQRLIQTSTLNIYFIRTAYKNTKFKPLAGLVPDKKFMVALALSAAITKTSQYRISDKSTILHILVGGICFLATLAIWTYENKDLAKLAIDRYRKSKKQE